MNETSTILELPYVNLKDEKLQAEIELLKAQKTRYEVQTRQWVREVERDDASAEEAGVYTFYGPITEKTVAGAIISIDDWRRRKPKADLTLIFNTPGGSLVDGLCLYDYLQELKSQGHKVITVGFGVVASMGAVLLQAGDERILGKNSFLMIHESSSETKGRTSEQIQAVKVYSKFENTLLNILTERSSMTRGQIKRKWTTDDWFMDAEEALKHGFIDEIR